MYYDEWSMVTSEWKDAKSAPRVREYYGITVASQGLLSKHDMECPISAGRRNHLKVPRPCPSPSIGWQHGILAHYDLVILKQRKNQSLSAYVEEGSRHPPQADIRCSNLLGEEPHLPHGRQFQALWFEKYGPLRLGQLRPYSFIYSSSCDST